MKSIRRIAALLTVAACLHTIGTSSLAFAFEEDRTSEDVCADEMNFQQTVGFVNKSYTMESISSMTWGFVSFSMIEGQEQWFNLLYTGSDTVEFEVENESVIQITDSFKEGDLFKLSVSALNSGISNITALSSNGDTAVLKVEVQKPINSEPTETSTINPSQKISWGLPYDTICVGEQARLNVFHTGDNEITCKVEDESILKIDEPIKHDGFYVVPVTALGCGETKLMAFSSDGQEAVCVITVTSETTDITTTVISESETVTTTTATISSEQRISWGLPYDTICVGEQARLNVFHTGDNEITCKVEDESILKIDEPIKYDGFYVVPVTALGCGETKLTAFSSDGQEAVCVITVTSETTDITTTAISESETVTTTTGGTDEVLPQTGMSGFHTTFAALAAIMGITGICLINKSRKEDEN